MRKHLVIATRGSKLALWQANHIKSCLEEINPHLTISLNIIRTKGDMFQEAKLAEVGGKGLFVKEIEQAILDGRADMAVHSMKDVPMELAEDLILGCIPKRESATDCFLSQNFSSFDELPQNAIVGTSSLRRQAQLLAKRPDLQIVNLRGNIDTRLNKLQSGQYDAIVLATAGLFRLGLHSRHMVPFDTDDFLPAIGQGALGIECHADNYDLLVMLADLEDRATRVCVQAERGFLAELDGGCQVPIAAYAHMTDEENIAINGLVAETDGSLILEGRQYGDAVDAQKIGIQLANELKAGGAQQILQKLYHSN